MTGDVRAAIAARTARADTARARQIAADRARARRLAAALRVARSARLTPSTEPTALETLP